MIVELDCSYSIDAYSSDFGSETHYAFAGNSPIKYIDEKGNFKVDPELEKKYKNLKPGLEVLRKEVLDMKKDDPRLKAMMKWGQFKDKKAIAALLEDGTPLYLQVLSRRRHLQA